MSSATGLVLLITLATSLTVVTGWGWSWTMEWSPEEPANCPHENHETHKCSTLESLNATCIVIKCCTDFADDEEYDHYDSHEESSEDDTVYYLGQLSDDQCGICFTSNPCSVYRCYNRCCDGYEPDVYGRCQNKTGHLQCQNGASPYISDDGKDMCICPEGFYGRSCEIPRCHCENGGECVVEDNKPYCTCSYGHYGEYCEKSNCSTRCYNGGECFRNGTLEFCRCPDNYVGMKCEHHFTQPDTCPLPDNEHLYCATHCKSNMDCTNDHVCCKEGCTTICRKPKAEYCMYEGRRFDIHQTHQPDPCTACTCTQSGHMMCSAMSCYIPICDDGRRPEPITGECCVSCPGIPPTNPPRINCPTRVLHLNTTYYTDSVLITGTNSNISAFDAQHKQLRVKYSPSSVSHCHCNKQQQHTSLVTASATDADGNVATCTFEVIVLDIHPPIFHSCPEDIYVFENKNIRWKEPTYEDNVGIAHNTYQNEMNNKVFPVGTRTLTYQIQDYDLNTAFCRFIVSVTRTDTDFADLPQGLKDRSTETVAMLGIISLVCGISLVAMLLVLFCCRRQLLARANRNARATSSQPPAYDNNIYATVGDIDVKLPPYSSTPMNPPAYSISGMNKDVTYMQLSPPSYTNHGYETPNDVYLTLNVHMPKPAKSVMSEKSVKSYDKE